MTISSLVIFLFILYLLFIVGQTVYGNYQSNKEVEKEIEKVEELSLEVKNTENRLNYYRTSSFKEKEAREKLGYKAPGETVVSLPIDQASDKHEDGVLEEVRIKVPNYILWWKYFFS